MSLLTPTATAALRAARPCLAPTLRQLTATSRPLTTLRPITPRVLTNNSPHTTRHASTTAAPAPETLTLDWDTYFQLRKTRRRIQVLFSVGGGAAGGTAGSYLLATGAAEPLVGLIPLDPFFTMGLMAFASATLGWLLGPIVGSGVFNMWHRRIKPQMVAKEREFFARIKKHRVDPTTSSVGNPVPDFYGEKISSVKGYRQWLKDQRAYNKKRSTFVV